MSKTVVYPKENIFSSNLILFCVKISKITIHRSNLLQLEKYVFVLNEVKDLINVQ